MGGPVGGCSGTGRAGGPLPDQAFVPGPVPDWDTPASAPCLPPTAGGWPPVSTGWTQTSQIPVDLAGPDSAGAWMAGGSQPTGPISTGPAPVTAPVVVSQVAAGVYLSGQGQGVRLEAPQPPAPRDQDLLGRAGGPGGGVGSERIQERRAAVARAVPRLQATPHGARGRAVADLAADWGVDPRTIHNDIEALTSAETADRQVAR